MEQELDDLFGDSNALSLPQSHFTYSVGQHIDELHTCGCTQYVICFLLLLLYYNGVP